MKSGLCFFLWRSCLTSRNSSSNLKSQRSWCQYLLSEWYGLAYSNVTLRNPQGTYSLVGCDQHTHPHPSEALQIQLLRERSSRAFLEPHAALWQSLPNSFPPHLYSGSFPSTLHAAVRLSEQFYEGSSPFPGQMFLKNSRYWRSHWGAKSFLCALCSFM